MKLKSFREWAKVNLKREDATSGDPQDLLQRAQVCQGKAQDDEIKGFLDDVIAYLSGQVGDQQGGDDQSDQATDGASNMAGGGGMDGMQQPMQAGGGMQNSTM